MKSIWNMAMHSEVAIQTTHTISLPLIPKVIPKTTSHNAKHTPTVINRLYPENANPNVIRKTPELSPTNIKKVVSSRIPIACWYVFSFEE